MVQRVRAVPAGKAPQGHNGAGLWWGGCARVRPALATRARRNAGVSASQTGGALAPPLIEPPTPAKGGGPAVLPTCLVPAHVQDLRPTNESIFAWFTRSSVDEVMFQPRCVAFGVCQGGGGSLPSGPRRAAACHAQAWPWL